MNTNQELTICFLTESVTLRCIASYIEPGIYRLEESTVMAAVESATYGDIVSLIEQEDGTFVFQSVIKPSGLKRYCHIASEKLVTSPLFQAILVEVMAQGGYWEQVFGGVVDIYLPQTATLDIKMEIDHIKSIVN